MKGSRSIIATVIAIGLLAVSTVAATAQEEDAATTAPVEFTGHIACGPEVRRGTDEWIPDAAGSSAGLYRSHGYAWRPVATAMSDPRLEGTYYGSYEWDEYRGAEGTTRIGAGTWRIENEAGAWQGSHSGFTMMAEGREVGSGATVILAGEGAYDGLHAALDVTDPSDIHGVIFPAPPPLPE